MTYECRPFTACNYIEVDGKKYLYLNDDNPSLGYTYHDLAFVAQPIYSVGINSQHNVITIPLMMTDEWPMLISMDDIHRLPPPIFKFGFIGQAHYARRQVFRTLELEDYLFEDTKPVYDLPAEKKREKLKSFLMTIQSCEFTFCPRGIGSSSFRAYQAMMMGSIPIITGMNDYPFDGYLGVNWDEFCLRGELEDLPELIEKAKTLNPYQIMKMRVWGMKFWERFCKHDALYETLAEIIRRENR